MPKSSFLPTNNPNGQRADRCAAGAERLARQDVLHIHKPLGLAFAVGMIAGCLKGGLRAAPMRRRKLAAGDVLFREATV